jgi:hypothetical protein
MQRYFRFRRKPGVGWRGLKTSGMTRTGSCTHCSEKWMEEAASRRRPEVALGCRCAEIVFDAGTDALS